jgi:hypothetical protein
MFSLSNIKARSIMEGSENNVGYVDTANRGAASVLGDADGATLKLNVAIIVVAAVAV